MKPDQFMCTIWRETLEGANFGELTRKTSLAENKLWQIDYESLIKLTLKQFEDTSAPI